MPARPLRTILALVVLALLLYVGARPVGPLPALGGFLDPGRGVWAVARRAELPRAATVAVPGLRGDVQVRYDGRGVPHIFATSEPDAYRALGYVVARDRLAQLYVQTLAATGRLTELAGARALPLDREMRRLGFGWAAERKLAAMDTTAPAVLAHAYGDGINAYIDGMRAEDTPLELRLVGARVPRWETINSIYLLERMGWTLAYLTPEVSRELAASRVGDAAAAALFPDHEPIVEPVQPNGQRAPRFDFAPLPPPGAPSREGLLADALRDLMPASAERLTTLGDEGQRGFASNNWAVAPARSASHHALLAGDPHLQLTLPSIWYEAHLVVPGALDVYGVTIPGAPGIVIGFNRDVAWTFTNTGADVLDFYAETVDDSARPTRYLVDGSWRPLVRRVETYRGKGGETVAVDTLWFTHRGPMRRERGRWLSMRWTVLEASNEMGGFQQAMHATSARAFEDAMAAHYVAPAQNMLSADRQGTIAIRSTGRFPIRPGDGSGLVVRDGSKSASDWQGWLPLERYPQAFDPPQGFLASANQQPVDARASRDYWGGWYDPWRALRINKLLRADSAVTPATMQRWQTDPGSERTALFLPYFVRAARAVAAHPVAGIDTAALRAAGELLARWDARYTLDNRQAGVFELAMRELTDRAWDELAEGRDTTSWGAPRRVATPETAVLLELLADSTSAWWDDHRTPDRVEKRDEIVARSLAAAFATFRARHGDTESDRWAWRNVRQANIYHLMQLDALSALRLPVAGGPGALWPLGGDGTEGPSWRMVVELGDTVRAWATYPGGQSGNPASARYRDRLPLWERGELAPLALPRAPGDVAAPMATLTLTPRR